MNRYDAVVFDLDGTLWDSTDTCLAAWAEVLAEVPEVSSPVTRDQIQGVFGLPHSEIGDRLLPFLPPDRRAEVLARCEGRENAVIRRQGGVLYEGIGEVLADLGSRYPLFLVSNCQDGYIEAFFAFHGLAGAFQDFESAGRTGLAKADNLRLVAQRNSLTRAVYVGDTQGDQKAAREAGMAFIHARYGFGTAPGAEVSLGSPRELGSLL
ncbi:MAG TPA: HAD family hydrolase [Spirochaetia bacterium]|nr:HAD family hydrolase [Spirochaetia bacterium]